MLEFLVCYSTLLTIFFCLVFFTDLFTPEDEIYYEYTDEWYSKTPINTSESAYDLIYVGEERMFRPRQYDVKGNKVVFSSHIKVSIKDKVIRHYYDEDGIEVIELLKPNLVKKERAKVLGEGSIGAYVTMEVVNKSSLVIYVHPKYILKGVKYIQICTGRRTMTTEVIK